MRNYRNLQKLTALVYLTNSEHFKFKIQHFTFKSSACRLQQKCSCIMLATHSRAANGEGHPTLPVTTVA